MTELEKAFLESAKIKKNIAENNKHNHYKLVGRLSPISPECKEYFTHNLALQSQKNIDIQSDVEEITLDAYEWMMFNIIPFLEIADEEDCL